MVGVEKALLVLVVLEWESEELSEPLAVFWGVKFGVSRTVE